MGACKESVECMVDVIHTVYKAVKGTVLLLEELQTDNILVIDVDSTNPDLTKIKKERKKGAFKTLIATILSVRCRDETTLKVMQELWKVHNTPEEFANAELEELEELVYSTGTYKQKALRIKETSRRIIEDHAGIVPNNMKQLLDLPGVGRKVANCVLNISYLIPTIAVDTHVHRISNRLGWVKTKTPNKTEFALMEIIPKSEWKYINYSFVSFGKTICKPITPQCVKCPVEEQCEKIIIKKEKKKKKN